MWRVRELQWPCIVLGQEGGGDAGACDIQSKRKMRCASTGISVAVPPAGGKREHGMAAESPPMSPPSPLHRVVRLFFWLERVELLPGRC